jgi:hypothetical protein
LEYAIKEVDIKVDLRKICFEGGRGVVGIGSGLYPVAGFVTAVVETLGSTTR